MTKLNYFRKNISEIEPLDKLLHELTIACNKLKSEKIEYSRVNDMFHASNELEKNKINLEKEDDKLMNYDTLNTNGRKLNYFTKKYMEFITNKLGCVISKELLVDGTELLEQLRIIELFMNKIIIDVNGYTSITIVEINDLLLKSPIITPRIFEMIYGKQSQAHTIKPDSIIEALEIRKLFDYCMKKGTYEQLCADLYESLLANELFLIKENNRAGSTNIYKKVINILFSYKFQQKYGLIGCAMDNDRNSETVSTDKGNTNKLNKKEGKPMVNYDANDNINLTMKIDKTATETINFLNQLRKQLLEDTGNFTLTKQTIFDEALDVINNKLRQLFIKPVINRSPNLTSFSIIRDPLIDKRPLEDEDIIEKLHKDIASLSEQDIDDDVDDELSDDEYEDDDLFDDEYEDEATIVYNNCKVINIQPYEINTTIFNNCTVINIDDIDFNDNDSLTNLLKLIEGTDSVG